MRFEVTQTYRSDADAVDAAYADPDLYPTLVGLPKLGGIEVIDHDRSGDTVSIRARYRFTGHLPAAVTAVVDPDKLSWVQESRHDLASGRGHFRMLPDHYPDRLKAKGTLLVADGGDGAVRTVTGELRVHALLVAGKVERAIVDGLREYLDAESGAVDAYVSRR